MFAPLRKGCNGSIGEVAPTQHGMTVGLMGTHGQSGVEKQHSLSGPAFQVTTRWDRLFQVVLNFLEDVLKRRREGHTILNRETQSVGLPRLVVRVLTYYDNLYLVKGTQVEGIEDEPCRRVARRAAVFAPNGVG